MVIGIIVPDRGDRPEFTENCFRMLKRQTLKYDVLFHADHEPLTEFFDITQRYRIGYEALRGKCDVILFIENDDYYAPDYIEYMVNQWEKHGRPDIIGTDRTIYYHIKERGHFTMHHKERSSAMSTLIRSDLNFKWCSDNQQYTDIHLYNTLTNKVIFTPEKVICMGIKHGVGKCGGFCHNDNFQRYKDKDPDFTFLKSVMDFDSLHFYSSYFSKL